MKRYLFLVLMIAFLPAPIKAEDNIYHPQGLKFGTLTAYPELYIKSTYSNNVYASSTNKKTDISTTLTPSIDLSSDWNSHALRAIAQAEIVRYAKEDDLDHTNHLLVTSFQFDVLRNSYVTVDLTHSVSHDNFFDTVAAGRPNAPIKQTHKSALLEWVTQPNRLLMALGFEVGEKSFENSRFQTTNAPYIQNDRNYSYSRVQARAHYETGGIFNPLAQISFTQKDYDRRNYITGVGYTGQDQDRSELSASVGFDYRYKGLLNGRVLVGYTNEDMDSTGVSDNDVVTFQANGRWHIQPKTFLSYALNRDSHSDYDSNQSLTETETLLRVDHSFTRRLNGSAGISHRWRDFQSGTSDDRLFTGFAGLDYDINRRVQIGTHLEYRSQSSNAAAREFDETLISLRLKTAF